MNWCNNPLFDQNENQNDMKLTFNAGRVAIVEFFLLWIDRHCDESQKYEKRQFHVEFFIFALTDCFDINRCTNYFCFCCNGFYEKSTRISTVTKIKSTPYNMLFFYRDLIGWTNTRLECLRFNQTVWLTTIKLRSVNLVLSWPE